MIGTALLLVLFAVTTMPYDEIVGVEFAPNIQSCSAHELYQVVIRVDTRGLISIGNRPSAGDTLIDDLRLACRTTWRYLEQLKNCDYLIAPEADAPVGPIIQIMAELTQHELEIGMSVSTRLFH